MATAIDIAWDRPTLPQIQATGATGVLRYLSPDPTKNITAAEVTEYHAAGLGTAVVWEGSATRALAGYAAGAADAHSAVAQLAAVGLPVDQVVYFAVDTDTDWASVSPYFSGAHSVLGANAAGLRRTGAYGGIRVIDGAAAAGFHYLWQTLAWSAGQRSAHATLYQNGATVLGGNADINEVLAADWGQYPTPGGADLPTPFDVWAYKGPGDNPDAHQSLRDAATNAAAAAAGVKALSTAVASIATAVGSVAAAVNKLGTADAALLADLQAAQAALAGIPAQVEAALKDGTVHVDVSVTGPTPTGV